MPSVTTSRVSGGTGMLPNRLFDSPVEGRRVDDVWRCLADALEKRAVAVGVEGIDRALAVQPPEPAQFGVREVEAVHRDLYGVIE